MKKLLLQLLVFISLFSINPSHDLVAQSLDIPCQLHHYKRVRHSMLDGRPARCVQTDQKASLCLVANEKGTEIHFKNGPISYQWPTVANYMDVLEDFEVVEGDLDGLPGNEYVVVQHLQTSNGLGMSTYRLTILNSASPYPVSFDLDEFGPGSWRKAPVGNACYLLHTEWTPEVPSRAMTLVGTIFKYSHEGLEPHSEHYFRILDEEFSQEFQRPKSTSDLPWMWLRDVPKTMGLYPFPPPKRAPRYGNATMLTAATMPVDEHRIDIRLSTEPDHLNLDLANVRLGDHRTGHLYPKRYNAPNVAKCMGPGRYELSDLTAADSQKFWWSGQSLEPLATFVSEARLEVRCNASGQIDSVIFLSGSEILKEAGIEAAKSLKFPERPDPYSEVVIFRFRLE